MAKKNGRPLKFQSLIKLQEKINKYFKECDDNKEPYTVTGLALALDTSRETLINYEKRENFFDTIKKAKSRVENFNEKALYRKNQVTGVIFNLKNNFGWRDQREYDVNAQVIIKSNIPRSKE